MHELGNCQSDQVRLPETTVKAVVHKDCNTLNDIYISGHISVCYDEATFHDLSPGWYNPAITAQSVSMCHRRSINHVCMSAIMTRRHANVDSKPVLAVAE